LPVPEQLTRDRIIATAIAMADRDGFDSVSLRGIASELNVHVTSLYNHVPTRDAITDGIVERLVDEAKLPQAPVKWEQWVRAFFAAIGTVAGTHPGAFTALHRRPVQGPQAAASFEVALEALRAAGFDIDDAYAAVKATTLTALAVGLERSVLSRGLLPETDFTALPVESFPQMHQLSVDCDPESVWSFTIDTLIAGLQAQLRRQKRGPRRG
jgi:AcrR family transcriptional regulator